MPDSSGNRPCNGCRTPSRPLPRARRAPRRSPQRVPAYLVGGAVRDLLLGSRDGRTSTSAIEGEVEALVRRAGRRARASTSSSRRRGSSSTAIKVDVARTRAETYPQPGRAAGGAPGAARARTSRAATSRSTRWPSRWPATSRADRPPRRPRRPAGGPPARAARALLHRRPDPGAAGGALRRAPGLRARARHRRAARADRSLHASPTTASRPSCAGSPRRSDPARALQLIDRWGVLDLGQAAPAGWPRWRGSAPSPPTGPSSPTASWP